MRHQGAGALDQARAHGRLGLRARRGQLERRIKRGKTAENPYIFFGQILTIFYFFYFILIQPVLNFIENNFWKNEKC